MNPGDVVLIALPQLGGGPPQLRPALVLSMRPGPFQNVLICGISTQVYRLVQDWDELISAADLDFVGSGLHHDSAIRLSYLYAAESAEIAGIIGQIDDARLNRLLARLASHLKPKNADRP